VRDSSNAAYFCLSTEDPEEDVGMFSFMEPTRRGARTVGLHNNTLSSLLFYDLCRVPDIPE